MKIVSHCYVLLKLIFLSSPGNYIFSKIFVCACILSLDDDFAEVVKIYKTLLNNDGFSGRLLLPDHRRFLMHLIGHHICALQFPKVNVTMAENDGATVHPVFSDFFNHSCGPNVALFPSDGSIVAVTIRPIQKNEELTIAYLPGIEYEDMGFKRRFHLERQFKFRCECKRCVRPSTPESLYTPSKPGLSRQFLGDCENDAHFHHKMQKMRKKLTMDCLKFLNENGHEQWNDYIELTISTYVRLLREKFYLNLHY